MMSSLPGSFPVVRPELVRRSVSDGHREPDNSLDQAMTVEVAVVN